MLTRAPSRKLHHTMAQTPKKNAAVPAGDDSASGQSAINGHVPTASEMKFIFTLVSNLKSKPDFDWEKIAANGGLTKKSKLESHLPRLLPTLSLSTRR